MNRFAIQFCDLFIELLHFMVINLQTYDSNLLILKVCIWCWWAKMPIMYILCIKT